MHILILANGIPPSSALLSHLRSTADLFIATDGAANQLSAPSLVPDVVLGDFDSLAEGLHARIPTAEFVHAPDQDRSDLDKALLFARERGARHVTIAGAGGGRIDHALTALSLLVKYGQDMDIRVADDGCEIRLVLDSAEVQGRIGDMVSLVVFTRAEGVTTRGLQWPLDNATLVPGSLGVSNVLIAPEARISVRSGWLLLCHLHDE